MYNSVVRGKKGKRALNGVRGEMLVSTSVGDFVEEGKKL